MKLLEIILVLIFSNLCNSQGLRRCDCVPNNQCYPKLQVDGGGQLDIRIVNGNDSNTTPPSVCTGGLIQCCTECGLNYNITYTPIKPATGQGKYGGQPWQVVILDNKYNYLGGGVLLDALNVLTAAHKVFALQSTPGNIITRFGEWDANQDIEEFRVQDINVSKVFIHESYVDAAKNLSNDIALLRLSKPVLYGPTVNPAINTACLPNATMNFEKMSCTVSGWGKNAFNGTYQSIIKEVEVKVVTSAECQTSLRTTKLGNLFLLDTKSFMCAGGEAGKDACVGDGGSPLMCAVNGRYQAVGLVAWGIGCAQAAIPGVYVRIQSYLDWIAIKLRTA